MKNTQLIIITLFASILMLSCKEQTEVKADGYGNFEATETTVSAESNGKLLQFDISEGQTLKANTEIGYTDTIQLQLKIEQIATAKNVIYSKSKSILSQIKVLEAELNAAQIAKARIDKLMAANIGTQKQVDDINGKIDVINKRMDIIKIQNAPVLSELKSIDVQIKQIEDQIKRCHIINPINGTVLIKYAEPFEIVNFGKPLYKIADLSKMDLRVYVSETQLPNIKLGQKVNVSIDKGDGTKSYEGTIKWIANEAEFTPKVIQTKEERVSLVYAVKIEVENDGDLKIGMPAEMHLK